MAAGGPRSTALLPEQNPIWAPIEPRPRPLWGSAREVISAYQRAESPVRLGRSQRYSLVQTDAGAAPGPTPEGRR